MIIEFKYDKNIDKECWLRLIKAGQMFGVEFPTEIGITEEKIAVAKKRIAFFEKIYKQNEQNLKLGLEKIYKNPVPNYLRCYINTSGYSMDNFEKGYVSVSANKNTYKDFLTILSHELAHYIFRNYYLDYCRKINCSPENIENIKEVLTVINNTTIKNIEDKGYKAHVELREMALDLWKNNNNLYIIINKIKESLK